MGLRQARGEATKTLSAGFQSEEYSHQPPRPLNRPCWSFVTTPNEAAPVLDIPYPSFGKHRPF